MGGSTSKGDGLGAVDPNPIRIRPEQSVRLLGIMQAKSTLVWADVVTHPHITFRSCVEVGIPPCDLYRMQPILKEWIQHGRCGLLDCDTMALWCPNPFTHFKCHIGDLVLHRKALPPACLRRCGLTVRELRERYGLTPELMCLLKYTPRDWYDLSIDACDIGELTPGQIERIFGQIKQADLIARSALLGAVTGEVNQNTDNNAQEKQRA